jgi:hypothetical protein
MMVVVELSALCGQPATGAQRAYAERKARQAFGDEWRLEMAKIIPRVKAKHLAESRADQADSCRKMAITVTSLQ